MKIPAAGTERRREFERDLLYGEIGETIGALLSDLGVSQRELARRMGRSESWVSRIVGAGENVTAGTLVDVGLALGLRFHLGAEELPDRDVGPTAADASVPDWIRVSHRG